MIVLMTVRFAAAVLVRTTVDVLPSLDSLTPLALRVVRVALVVAVVGAALLAAGGAALLLAGAATAAAAPLLVLVAAALDADPADELAVDTVVAFRVVAAARVDRAFSTMFPRRLVVPSLVGETGRAMSDLFGDGATT